MRIGVGEVAGTVVLRATIVISLGKVRRQRIDRLVGEVPVFVRVQLFGPADLLTVTVDNKTWIKGDDGYYYYCRILQAKPDEPYITPKDTLVGTVSVTPKQAAELGDSFTVTAVQECSTIIYDDNNEAQPMLGWTLPDKVARQ